VKTKRLKSIVKVKAKRHDNNIMSYGSHAFPEGLGLDGSEIEESLYQSQEAAARAFERIHNP